MIWFAAILAAIIGIIVGVITHNLRRAVFVSLGAFVLGVILSLIIVFSGLLGG